MKEKESTYPMKIETLIPQAENEQYLMTMPLAHEVFNERRVLQIEPEDPFETIVLALRLQSEPVILFIPENSQAFNDPSRFAQIRQICPPDKVSFVFSRSRIGVLGRYAHQHGFPFASSVEKAAQFLPMHVERHTEGFQMSGAIPTKQGEQIMHNPDHAVEHEHPMSLDEPEGFPEQTHTSPPENPSRSTLHPSLKRSSNKNLALMVVLIALLVTVGIVLLPVLFSAQPVLKSIPEVPPATSVGTVAFKSSGQLDPNSMQGLNDTISVDLHSLSTLATGQSYYAWLMSDTLDDNTPPLLLGRLSITGGKTNLTYVHPNHENLLANYSQVEVAQQPSDPMPMMPPLDPKAVSYSGRISTVPTPGDEQHYSLLSHLRHLLAKDPTLQQVGLAGGLDIWLYRNAEKVLEWSSAARDSWQGGQQSDLIHRQMIRVLDTLDGAAYVATTGDVPAGSPLLVDPKAGRIGLLAVNQTQVLPSYLTHVDIHLLGLINSPGHTQEQQQRAIKLDMALKQVRALMQRIHQDAIKVVKMNTTQLKSNEALAFLNDMVTNATSAYAGQFDPATGGNMNGVVWIHNELQGLATIPVMVASANKG